VSPLHHHRVKWSSESGHLGRIGTSVQAHGVLCQWLIQLLNLVTGNLDRPGGVMLTSPAVDPLGILRLAEPGSFGA